MLKYMGRFMYFSCFRCSFFMCIGMALAAFMLTSHYNYGLSTLERSTLSTCVTVGAKYDADTESHPSVDTVSHSKQNQYNHQEEKLPISLFQLTLRQKQNCAFFPGMKTLRFNNLYWQIMDAANGLRIYLYSAYFDNRTLLNNNPVIRLIVMISKPVKQMSLYCHLWSDKKELLVTRVSSLYKLSPTYPSDVYPYLITCKSTNEFNISSYIPEAVSLTTRKCSRSSNILRIINNVPPNRQPKKGIAVCIKGLDYLNQDISIYLVEWLELLFIMGVDKVIMYEYVIHPNISRVIRHYQDLGLVELIPLTLAGDAPNDPYLRHRYLNQSTGNGIYINQILNEKIPYNDCFYRNMNLFEYIAVLDTDEIIIPKIAHDWKKMMKKIKYRNHTSSYHFRRVIVLNQGLKDSLSHGIPKHMTILQNVKRSKYYEMNPKSIYNTEKVLALSTHVAKYCLKNKKGKKNENCLFRRISSEIGHVLHFRSSCKEGKEKFCGDGNTVKDTEVWKYKEKLVERTSNVLKYLKLI